MLFGAAVHQGSALFAKAGTSKGRAGAVTQQALQRGAVVRLNAHTGIHREAAVLVSQHLFGVTTPDQTTPDKGAQNAAAQISLRFSHGNLIDSTDLVEDDARRCGLGIGISFARHNLKHPVNHANMEVHMRVQVRSEAVNEGDCADVQGCLIHPRRTGAVGR